jgi:hypothetical protein
MARFVIATENWTKDEANTLTTYCVHSNFAYWHWLDALWLIEYPGDISAMNFHAEICVKNPALVSKTCLVLRVDDPKTYWGLGSTEGWNWLGQHGEWGKNG